MVYTFFVILIAIVAVLLCVVVLMQSGQGSGLSGGIAGDIGGGAGNMVGARRTADFLSKSTSVLGAVFLVLCLMANFFIDAGGVVTRSAVQERGMDVPMEQQDPTLPTETAPAVPVLPDDDQEN